MVVKFKKFILPTCFVAVEIVLYALIFTISGPANKWLSFVSILLCFLFALGFIARSKTKLLTQIGLLTTVCADVFLVLLGKHQVVAMSFFCVTQIAYFLRIYFNSSSKKEKIAHLVVRGLVVLGTVLATILVLKQNLDALSLISMFYYANLVVNVVFAFVQTKKSVLFALGLLLFAFCDAFIGLAVLENYLPISQSVKEFLSITNWAWVFYVPAQVLIALSITFNSYKNKRRKHEDN